MIRTIGTAPVAGLGRRAAAVLVDGLLALLAGGWLVVVVAVRALPGGSGGDADGPSVPGWAVALCWGALLVLTVAQWVLHGRLGWTLGRRLLGVRTVDVRTRRPVGMARVLLRGLVVAAGALVLGVGQYVVLLSPLLDGSGRRQGWHDKAARDLVLDVRGVGAPVPPPPPRPEVARAATAISFRGAPDGQLPVSPPPPVPGGLTPPPPGAAVRPSGAPDAPGASVAPATGPLVLAPLAPRRAGPDLDTRALPLVPPPPRPVPPPPAHPEPVVAPTVARAAEIDDEDLDGEDDEDVETTRRRVDLPPSGAPAAGRASGPLTAAVLTLSDGQRVVVQRTALVGRNPAAAADGVQLVRVVDPGRSVSKTHLQIAVEPTGVWVADRGSTNGTVVTLPDGGQVICPVDHPVRLRIGAVVVFGDCAMRLVETTS
ncbi:FHA domain-containing protein [Cellulomonas sp. DKR-3]|uniref:FHA domain-containing protein n=1 Tax=Cellulomonas fulva TaxID=2835530 RepID=A0ABS5U021_9CELL|nr:RDD family protein [Cellulomonas fulva]MBT0994757.1 FHA domain-containing protein [Cellulomonas fulva]